MINEVFKLLSPSIKCLIKDINIDFSKLTEIRLRINEPLIFVFVDGEYFLCEKRNFTVNRKLCSGYDFKLFTLCL